MGKRAPPLRTSYCTSVGRAALSPPADNRRTHGRARGPCPTKNTIVGRDPCVPLSHRTPCKKPVIAKPVRTLAVAIRPPCPRATARVAPTLPLSTFSFSLFHPSHAKPLRKPRLPEGFLMPNFNFPLKGHAADQRHQAQYQRQGHIHIPAHAVPQGAPGLVAAGVDSRQ